MNSSISSFGICREAWYATGTEQQVTQISVRSCPAKRRDDNNGTVFCCTHRFILRGTSAHTLYTAPIHDVVKLMAISSYRKRSRTASACVQRQHRSVGPMACANGCDDNDRRKSTENDHMTNAITIAVGASALATTDGKNGENCKPVVPTSTVGYENFKAKEAAPWRKNAMTKRRHPKEDRGRSFFAKPQRTHLGASTEIQTKSFKEKRSKLRNGWMDDDCFAWASCERTITGNKRAQF